MTAHIIFRRLQQRHVAQHLFCLDKLRRRIFDLDANRIEQLTGAQIGRPVGTGEGQNIASVLPSRPTITLASSRAACRSVNGAFADAVLIIGKGEGFTPV